MPDNHSGLRHVHEVFSFLLININKIKRQSLSYYSFFRSYTPTSTLSSPILLPHTCSPTISLPTSLESSFCFLLLQTQNPLCLDLQSRVSIISAMNPQQHQNPVDPDQPQLPTIKIHHPSSPRHHSTPTPTAGARRKIGVAVDLSDESAYAVRWGVHHYIRPGDAVILLHVSPTSVLFGADWGPLPLSTPTATPTHSDFNSSGEDHPNSVTNNNSNNQKQQQLEEDFDAFTASKVADLARPLREAQIPYKIHIVKDHDMKERLCLEVERLGLSAVIMGSRGFGAAKRGSDGRLGSVSDYCVHHCVCPVVVVRYPDDKDGGNGEGEAVVNVPIEEDEEEPTHKG